MNMHKLVIITVNENMSKNRRPTLSTKTRLDAEHKNCAMPRKTVANDVDILTLAYKNTSWA